MQRTKHGQDEASPLISVLCRHLEIGTVGVSLQIMGA